VTDYRIGKYQYSIVLGRFESHSYRNPRSEHEPLPATRSMLHREHQIGIPRIAPTALLGVYARALHLSRKNCRNSLSMYMWRKDQHKWKRTVLSLYQMRDDLSEASAVLDAQQSSGHISLLTIKVRKMMPLWAEGTQGQMPKAVSNRDSEQQCIDLQKRKHTVVHLANISSLICNSCT